MTSRGGNGPDNQDEAPSGRRLNRPQRNNNPGNIEYGPFARSQGAIGREPEGRFAVFASPREGFRALVNLLQTDSYQSRTLSAAIHRFAPSSENNTAAYIQYVENRTGIPRHTRLNDLSPRELEKVALAKATYEGWKPARSGEKLALTTADDDRATTRRTPRRNPDETSPEKAERGEGASRYPSRDRVVEVAAEDREEKPSRRPRRGERSEQEGSEKSLKDRFGQQVGDRPTANRTGKEAAPAPPSLKQAFQDRYAEAQDKPAAPQTAASSTLPAGAKHDRNGFNDQTWPTAASHYADEGGIKVARNATQDFAPAAAGVPTPAADTLKPTTPAPAFRLEEPGWNG